MLVDSVIFDLDGTLWDSSAAVAASWRETLARHYGALTQPSEEDARSIMGMTVQQIIQALFLPYGELAEKACRQCIEEECEYIALHGNECFAGVAQLFSALSPKLGIYIVSNCEKGYIPCFIKCSGLGEFIRDYECSGSTGLSKAENIRLIMERNGLKAPVYLGDTHMDEAAARKAGIPFIHATYGFGHAQAPDKSINAPLELLNVIEVIEHA